MAITLGNWFGTKGVISGGQTQSHNINQTHMSPSNMQKYQTCPNYSQYHLCNSKHNEEVPTMTDSCQQLIMEVK